MEVKPVANEELKLVAKEEERVEEMIRAGCVELTGSRIEVR